MIHVDGTVAAVAGPSRVFLAPWLHNRPMGDPLRVRVAVMSRFAHSIEVGDLPGPYSDARAEAYADLVLAAVSTEQNQAT